MNDKQRQTIIFMGFMAMLVIVTVFFVAQGALQGSNNDTNSSSTSGGSILPAPLENIVDDAIGGLQGAYKDAKIASGLFLDSRNSSQRR